MRYFKYDDLNPSDRKMITQYTNLTEQEEKKNRQAKILETLATVLSLFLFLSLFVGGLAMFVSFAPSSDTPVLRVFFFLFVFLFAKRGRSAPVTVRRYTRIIMQK